MNLPAFSGHKKAINLLPKDPFEDSSIGVVLGWSLQFGKWAVILTQLVVMTAFLWRFSLDRKLTNLNRKIEQQKAVIESYSQVESDFLLAQKQLQAIKPAIQNQKKVADALKLIEAVTPSDVWYDRISITESSITTTAYSASLSGFSRLLTALQRRPEFSSVNVGSIENGGANGAQLAFDITLRFAGAKQ